MNTGHFHVRIQMDLVPAEQQQKLALKDDRNYPVLAVDGEKNRLLLHDDQMRLVWLPMGVCRFVRLG